MFRKYSRVAVCLLVLCMSACQSPAPDERAESGWTLDWDRLISFGAPDPILFVEFESSGGDIGVLPPSQLFETVLIWSLADDGIATIEEMEAHAQEFEARQQRNIVYVLNRAYRAETGHQLESDNAVFRVASANSSVRQCPTVEHCVALATDLWGETSDFGTLTLRLGERATPIEAASDLRPLLISDPVELLNPTISLTLPTPSADGLATQIPGMAYPVGATNLAQIDTWVDRRVSGAGFPRYAAFVGEHGRLFYISQAERVDGESGVPFTGTERWSTEPLGCRASTFGQRVRCIFAGDYTEIHMRVFAFAFTDSFGFSGASDSDAARLIRTGRIGPRAVVRADPVPRGNEMHVLVYEIVAEGGSENPQFRLRDGTQTVADHLRDAAIMGGQP